ncbi:helix-turn-helix transcriptional regulator [Sphingosinithalassobacter tenebrarum]|uniref:Helix-turn-helix transcriptional regulator n=2 Tax=Stakelama tenebrarum TaxID=2711215 RepID=A0A6G6YAQ0_9SPHN|nr:helix-turn-helix transcriptional regulator [Sphingosinithalassobacter tenebrarum]
MGAGQGRGKGGPGRGFGGPGRGFGGPGGPGGGRGRRKMFDGGELKLLLLKLIAETPRHGYDLIREIEERTEGFYAPSPGVIYPTLTLLAEMGLIEERQCEGAKKQFAATGDGEAHLAEHADEAEALIARLSQLAALKARHRGGPVHRAMGNLKAVLQMQLDDEANSEKLHEIADIIDETARRIERL